MIIIVLVVGYYGHQTFLSLSPYFSDFSYLGVSSFLSLLPQESPLHTSNSLDSLLTMASKKGKRECVFAVGGCSSTPVYRRLIHLLCCLFPLADTLKELWLTDLLPGNRKLKSLKQVRTVHPSERKRTSRIS